ncbi:disease resistance protein RPM1-like [Phragmites australis]|uniref:disease resistance protein RPM1-like n=1 Tax=Phragmites australis TaxID=29695 RepID=UPI002D79CA7B|nr:disease resistance protein RPM1-like [Phragmites australis]
MAEAIAISLSAKLGVVLSRSAALGISRLLGVRSDIAAAKQDLDLLRAFLHFADSRYGTDDHAAEWVRQVRDAAFELEDVADECSYLSGHGLARDCVNVKAWFALSRRLRKARERLCQLSRAKEQWDGIRPADGPAPSVTTISAKQAESAHFLEKEEIVGFSAQEKQLLDWVVKDAEQRRTLVAVWGMGGVGKTTLVTGVYKQVATSHFDCAAWVAVSRSFTMDDLLRKILKELHRDAHWGSVRSDSDVGADYRSLMAAMRDHLSKRRYLVVLDDVWDAHLWNKLRLAFLDVTNRSRVIITTRNRDVAKAAAPERTMMLEPLPSREAWELFCAVAFREASDSGQTCPGHLKELAVNILHKCRGLPLAIVSVGNLLALKEKTEFAWRNAYDSLMWDTRSSDLGIGEAAKILNLSIDDLPHHLKKCFLSCSVYPEDLLIKRKILIRRWVARGFIEEKPRQRKAEDVADDYLDQLVQRSLMQVVERNEFGRVKRCVIHDLIRELIIHRSREEEGFLHFAMCNITIDCKVRIRHLAIDRCEVDSHYVPQWATPRSLNAFGSKLDASFLSCFRLLTVLNLWFVEMNKLPDSVTNLHNLRYLGIRSTLVKELPKELGKLQKLQTLDAKLSMVQRLPSSIAKLKSLRHLIVLTRETTDLLKPYPGMAVGVPKGIENLTSLQTLKYVQADKIMVRSLARLEEMRSLELSGVNAGLIVDLSSSISRMSCLLRLGLVAEPGADTVLDLESISRPPLKLQNLVLTGRLARGKLPSWICSLTSLVQLRLCGCQIAHDSLLLLAALPRLVNLGLIAAYHERNMVFVQGSFPTLQKLTLEDLPNLSHIEFQEGCLVNLRHLVIGLCTKLTETPQGMEKLMMHLQNLQLFGMPTEFVANLKEQNGHARYHNPANSDFYQAYRFLNCIRFVERNK